MAAEVLSSVTYGMAVDDEFGVETDPPVCDTNGIYGFEHGLSCARLYPHLQYLR